MHIFERLSEGYVMPRYAYSKRDVFSAPLSFSEWGLLRLYRVDIEQILC